MNVDLGVSLAEFAQGKNQPEVAEIIGVSQSAISQMFKSAREIRVRRRLDGVYEAFEIRLVGSRRKKAA